MSRFATFERFSIVCQKFSLVLSLVIKVTTFVLVLWHLTNLLVCIMVYLECLPCASTEFRQEGVEAGNHFDKPPLAVVSGHINMYPLLPRQSWTPKLYVHNCHA